MTGVIFALITATRWLRQLISGTGCGNHGGGHILGWSPPARLGRWRDCKALAETTTAPGPGMMELEQQAGQVKTYASDRAPYKQQWFIPYSLGDGRHCLFSASDIGTWWW